MPRRRRSYRRGRSCGDALVVAGERGLIVGGGADAGLARGVRVVEDGADHRRGSFAVIGGKRIRTKGEWKQMNSYITRGSGGAFGGRLVRPATGYLGPNGMVRGRLPVRGVAKQQVTLRIDPDLIAKFREGGPGW